MHILGEYCHKRMQKANYNWKTVKTKINPLIYLYLARCGELNNPEYILDQDIHGISVSKREDITQELCGSYVDSQNFFENFESFFSFRFLRF